MSQDPEDKCFIDGELDVLPPVDVCKELCLSVPIDVPSLEIPIQEAPVVPPILEVIPPVIVCEAFCGPCEGNDPAAPPPRKIDGFVTVKQVGGDTCGDGGTTEICFNLDKAVTIDDKPKVKDVVVTDKCDRPGGKVITTLSKTDCEVSVDVDVQLCIPKIDIPSVPSPPAPPPKEKGCCLQIDICDPVNGGFKEIDNPPIVIRLPPDVECDCIKYVGTLDANGTSREYRMLPVACPPRKIPDEYLIAPGVGIDKTMYTINPCPMVPNGDCTDEKYVPKYGCCVQVYTCYPGYGGDVSTYTATTIVLKLPPTVACTGPRYMTASSGVFVKFVPISCTASISGAMSANASDIGVTPADYQRASSTAPEGCTSAKLTGCCIAIYRCSVDGGDPESGGWEDTGARYKLTDGTLCTGIKYHYTSEDWALVPVESTSSCTATTVTVHQQVFTTETYTEGRDTPAGSCWNVPFTPAGDGGDVNCFRLYVCHTDYGTWTAASPEVIVSVPKGAGVGVKYAKINDKHIKFEPVSCTYGKVATASVAVQELGADISPLTYINGTTTEPECGSYNPSSGLGCCIELETCENGEWFPMGQSFKLAADVACEGVKYATVGDKEVRMVPRSPGDCSSTQSRVDYGDKAINYDTYAAGSSSPKTSCKEPGGYPGGGSSVDPNISPIDRCGKGLNGKINKISNIVTDGCKICYTTVEEDWCNGRLLTSTVLGKKCFDVSDCTETNVGGGDDLPGASEPNPSEPNPSEPNPSEPNPSEPESQPSTGSGTTSVVDVLLEVCGGTSTKIGTLTLPREYSTERRVHHTSNKAVVVLVPTSTGTGSASVEVTHAGVTMTVTAATMAGAADDSYKLEPCVYFSVTPCGTTTTLPAKGTRADELGYGGAPTGTAWRGSVGSYTGCFTVAVGAPSNIDYANVPSLPPYADTADKFSACSACLDSYPAATTVFDVYVVDCAATEYSSL